MWHVFVCISVWEVGGGQWEKGRYKKQKQEMVISIFITCLSSFEGFPLYPHSEQ